MEKIDRFAVNLVDIPNRDREEGTPKFWEVLESNEIKLAMIFCLVNDLRNCGDVSKMSSRECRSNLVKCQSYVAMLDLDETLINQLSRPIGDEEDNSPADVEFADLNEEELT